MEGVEHDQSDREFLNAILNAVAMRYVKRADYNREGITYLDYFPFGEQSGVHNIFCKSQRLVSILKGAGPDGRRGPVNESINDAYIDIIVHAGFALARRMIRGEVQTPGTPPPTV